MGVDGQCQAPAALPPGKTLYPLYRRLGGPQGRSGWVQKISPPPGFDPWSVHPVASRYTDCAIPAHFLGKIRYIIRASQMVANDNGRVSYVTQGDTAVSNISNKKSRCWTFPAGAECCIITSSSPFCISPSIYKSTYFSYIRSFIFERMWLLII